MINRVLDLPEITVREVMTGRNEIVSISIDASLDDVLTTMIEHQHSRLPVWRERPDQIVGVLFFKDLLPVWQERRRLIREGRPPRPFRVPSIMRKPVVVPETKTLAAMLEEFRSGHSHMALVVDEFGTVTGLLTIEDVLEQIVGEINDEYDDTLHLNVDPSEDLVLDGATKIRDIDSQFGLSLPVDAGFETLAGYILFRLGHIPRVGEFVDFDHRRLIVDSMERNRIARVRVTRIETAEKAS
jgi:putative hemolysin